VGRQAIDLGTGQPEVTLAGRGVDNNLSRRFLTAVALPFQPVNPNRTWVSLRLAYEPETFGEKVGDSLGFVTRRIEGDLERFKEFIQNRGVETGAWRGKIDSGKSRGLKRAVCVAQRCFLFACKRGDQTPFLQGASELYWTHGRR